MDNDDAPDVVELDLDEMSQVGGGHQTGSIGAE